MSTKYIGEKMTKEVMRAILDLIKITGSYTSRGILEHLQNDHSPASIRSMINHLKRQKYLNGGAYKGYTLTQKGKTRLDSLSLMPMQQTTPWDKVWRLVIYDIPEEHRKSRNSIRKLLKSLGFFQIQQSVWAHPMPCLPELEKIRNAYGQKNHLLFIDTIHAKEYDFLLKLFEDTYPNLLT